MERNEGTAALAEDGNKPRAPARRTRTSGLDRVLQIMDHLQATERPASAYEIARSVGAPISTVYVLIDELVEKCLLDRVEGNRVWLGPRLFHYGLAYTRSLDLLSVATEAMQALARDLGETVQICNRDEGRMVVLAMAEGPGPFHVTSRVGTRVPLNWTASGKLLVGHLPRAERRALFRRHALPSPTGRAETDPAVLADSAADALARRLSVQMGESDYSVACIAAPIRDEAGACVATISIVLPEDKARRGRTRYAKAVQSAALGIEHRLGHSTRG
ncbi:MAG TPA: IclR family transcriptional regulator [Acetobacteraceae bacterium]|jgi:DNA-binding IclR family transcriptional regulator|nr:IclR family transcriptional regulator [Acetobacteraceae bacterium]